MLRPLHRAYLLIAFAILPIGNASVVAPEEVGTSAVPFTSAPPPSRPRPPAQNKRPQDQAGAQRARWPAYNFPAPNGGLLVFTIMPSGNPACASYDGSGCLWGLNYDQIDFRRVRPLVCGQEHRARWGVTGYEDPQHWCSLARTLRGSRG
ncbi:MAG TPA: hypothetical protein VK603_20150 [Candidatus Saccharimonadales bacterium]|jgi:hypothetical protein|nr:hypothetical protein [Candidatus Saccharimonadales bacterium]